jgi:hypothetical protein
MLSARNVSRQNGRSDSGSEELKLWFIDLKGAPSAEVDLNVEDTDVT